MLGHAPGVGLVAGAWETIFNAKNSVENEAERERKVDLAAVWFILSGLVASLVPYSRPALARRAAASCVLGA